MFLRLRKWWLFHVQNPVVRAGKKGAFVWRFRRYTLELSTLSGNWKMVVTASEHPYGYLYNGSDDQVQGFCEMVYFTQATITTDQGLVDDIRKAFQKYDKRMEKVANKKVDESEEEQAMKEMQELQEFIELPKKERKKAERDINGRFKKAVKQAKKNEPGKQD